MSLYDKWNQGFENKDIDAMAGLLHDDFAFVRHQSGATINKSQMLEMLQGFMNSDAISSRDQRCLYENNDVMVEHSVVDFPDGSTEAILACHTLKGGQIIRMETGATLIKSDG
ncbi:MAG: nuclear transport factor 2 family protein [Myxococcota bacterium]|nr:nuclear transport factor 2 family protein [Myxococcota bacterium]